MLRTLALVAVSLVAGGAWAACGDDAGIPDARTFDGRPSGGTASLTWSLRGASAAVTCDQVGGVSVTVTLSPTDGGSPLSDSFLCTSGKGTTKPITPNTYDVEVTLSGATGVLATADLIKGVKVPESTDASLGAVTFKVNDTGGARFRLGADGKTSNCGGGATGAGITTTRLELQDIDGKCVTTTFAIAAGAAQPATTFNGACPVTATTACVEQDQDVRITGLASGRYRLVLEGRIGAAVCWLGTPVVRVPAGGVEGSLPSLTLVATGAAGCPKVTARAAAPRR